MAEQELLQRWVNAALGEQSALYGVSISDGAGHSLVELRDVVDGMRIVLPFSRDFRPDEVVERVQRAISLRASCVVLPEPELCHFAFAVV
jgi:hypothetical protein